KHLAYRWDKWTKHRLMLRSPRLRAVLPHTLRLNEQNFYMMAKKFGQVIVKPSAASGGKGVIKVSRTRGGLYHVHHGKSRQTLSLRGAYAEIARLRSRKYNNMPYLVQQRINLATINRKLFDIRVMVQRKKGTDWQVTGVMGKIAGPGYFITNLARSKGT